MAVHKKYPALGRGLDALISTKEVHTDGSSTINEIELDKISPNPNQPRRDFDPESLRELADSIAEIGIVQPITLRKMEDDSFRSSPENGAGELPNKPACTPSRHTYVRQMTRMSWKWP